MAIDEAAGNVHAKISTTSQFGCHVIPHFRAREPQSHLAI